MCKVEFRYNVDSGDSESSHILRRYTMSRELTQTLLHSLFNYNENTGIFTHKIKKGGTKKDSIAGTAHSKGYRVLKIYSKAYKAHRLAWLYVHGTMPKEQIDHINGIKNDNRISNLREVSDYDQCRNKPIPKNNTSGVLGVHWCKTMKRWTAHIGVDGKSKTLGRFKDKDVAVKARRDAEKLYDYHKNHGRST